MFHHHPTFSSHNELCKELKRDGMLRTPLAYEAFKACDRKHFTPQRDCYTYAPQLISKLSPSTAYHVTISSPAIHAHGVDLCAEAVMKTEKDDKGEEYVPTRTICDVASGSGYVTAVFGKMLQTLRQNTHNIAQIAAQKHSKVVGVEILQNLVTQSIENIKSCDPNLLKDDLVGIHRMDAFRNRLPHAPFDVIHTGVCIQFMPLALLSQLKVGGKAILVLQDQEHHNKHQKFYEFTRKHVSPRDLAHTPFPAFKDDDEKMFDYALALQEEVGKQKEIDNFVDTFFSKRFLYHCEYILAQTDKSAPQHLEMQKVKH